VDDLFKLEKNNIGPCRTGGQDSNSFQKEELQEGLN
jgi:hypothetical protein